MTKPATCDRCGETWTRDPALEVPCPVCLAKVGQLCRRPSGHGCDIHHARDRAALEAGVFEKCTGPKTKETPAMTKKPPTAAQKKLAADAEKAGAAAGEAVAAGRGGARAGAGRPKKLRGKLTQVNAALNQRQVAVLDALLARNAGGSCTSRADAIRFLIDSLNGDTE